MIEVVSYSIGCIGDSRMGKSVLRSRCRHSFPTSFSVDSVEEERCSPLDYLQQLLAARKKIKQSVISYNPFLRSFAVYPSTTSERMSLNTHPTRSCDSTMRRAVTVVWVDANVNSSEENQNVYRIMSDTFDTVNIFETVPDCEEYIRSVPTDVIVLVASGRLSRDIIPAVNTLEQVSAMFIYCMDPAPHERWIEHYPKVRTSLRCRCDAGQ